MILERLVLENFRQFKGRQELVFSDVKKKNVTLVHAENGFGKTTLLKALLWGLYGRPGLMGTDGKPDDFEKPDRIIHEGLARSKKDPNEIIATVEITFKHDDDRYILTRSLSLAQQENNPRQTKLTLEVMQDGQTRNCALPQKRIETIVPDGIRKFLFFNGERINYLAMEENSEQVTDAIHQMLGIRLLKTTVDDLKHTNVRGKLRNEQKDSTCAEKVELIEKITSIENKISKYGDFKQQTNDNIKAIKDEIDAVDLNLAANREARELQAKRIELKNQSDELKKELKNILQRISKILATEGYSLFTTDMINRGQKIVGNLRSEGKIPARVLNTFLQELLDSGTCICKRSLDKRTPERNAVKALLSYAADQDFNNAVGALDNAMGRIKGSIKQTEEQLQQLNFDRLNIIEKIRECDEGVEEIHQILGNKKDEEVQNLEEKRKQLELDLISQSKEVGRIGEKISSLIADKEDIENQIRQIKDKEETAARAQRRINAVEDCIDILQGILDAETEDLRPLLNKEIDKHFRKIMTKDYWVELTSDYTLRILKRVVSDTDDKETFEIDAALSTGERTVTSLVFIASLLALARRRSEIPTILKGLSGSEFPAAIDSPFGSLSIFRRGVARYLPELATQVLLLVSPEQYDGQVEEALNEYDRVGKRYYLEYHGPTMPDRANPELVVNGQTIQQYFSSSSEEYTAIKKL